MITFKLIYDRKHEATRNKPATVELRITQDRKIMHISTGIRLLKSEWTGNTVQNRPDAAELNDRLRVIIKLVQAFITDSMNNGTPIEKNALKSKIWPVISNENTNTAMLEWLRNETDRLNIKEGTMKHYRTLITRIEEYGRLSSWNDLSVERIYDFDAWLHQLKAVDGSPISDAGVYSYHKCLKALLNRAFEMDRIQQNPYHRLKGKFKRGDKESIEFLAEDEMQRFEALVLPEGSIMAKVKDVFVFQMYTGLAYSDAMAFDISQYKKEGDRWVNVKGRIKTGVPYISQLLPPVVHVLEKYDMQLPYIDNADYNHALKILGAAAGITTKMHSHLARHTFATYMLRNGAKIENVTRMLGQTNITQTQRYAKVLAESVHEDFDRIENKLKRK